MLKYTLKLETTEFYCVDAKDDEDALSKVIRNTFDCKASISIVKKEEINAS